MDRQAEWPWSWEEEAEWKAELEERDNAFVEELIEDAVEDREVSQVDFLEARLHPTRALDEIDQQTFRIAQGGQHVEVLDQVGYAQQVASRAAPMGFAQQFHLHLPPAVGG